MNRPKFVASTMMSGSLAFCLIASVAAGSPGDPVSDLGPGQGFLFSIARGGPSNGAARLVTDGTSVVLDDHFSYVGHHGKTGRGIEVDDRGYVYVSNGGGTQIGTLDVLDGSFDLVARVTVGDNANDEASTLAYRSTVQQILACHETAGHAAPQVRVFDVSDPLAPYQINLVDLPFPPGFPNQCLDMEIDGDGHLWTLDLTPFGVLHTLTLDALGNIVASESFSGVTVGGGPPGSLAIDDANGNILVSHVNTDVITVGSLSGPTPETARITDVCGHPSGSPGDMEVSAAGDLYIGCSNNVVATDIAVIPASSLVGLTGAVTADDLGVVRHEIPGIAPIPNFRAGSLAHVMDPRAAAERLTDLVALVEELETAGEFNHGEATSLITKLQQALAALEQDPPDVARAQERILKFINDLDKMIPKKLSDALGQPLIEEASAIWDQLNGA